LLSSSRTKYSCLRPCHSRGSGPITLLPAMFTYTQHK
jgi:hypothetical protein